MTTRDVAAVTAATAMLAGTGWLWAEELRTVHSPTSMGQVCKAYRSFAGTLLGKGANAEAAIRMTATRLQLAADAQQPEREEATTAAGNLARVLALTYSSRDDLFIAARPVAKQCGIDWRQSYRWQIYSKAD